MLAGVCFSVMSTMLFPWSYVEVLTGGLSNYIQFSWRFLMKEFVSFSVQIWKTFGLSQPSRNAECEKINLSGHAKLNNHSLFFIIVL